MAGFFFHLGRAVGTGLRKANWVFRSLAGTEAEAIEAEVAVGRDLANALTREAQLERDAEAEALLDDLGARLAGGLRERRFAFTCRVVNAAECNAFALPGGFLFVSRPLLELCRGEPDELAFVLGHEMGHVVLRHAIDRLMAHSALRAAVGRLSVGGGVLGRSVAGLAAAVLSGGYAQDQELDADRVAVRLAAATGFDPAGGERLLGRLGGVSGAMAGLSRYFSTHPPFEVRLAAIGRLLRG
jgi:predicted Zn-dependent protease